LTFPYRGKTKKRINVCIKLKNNSKKRIKEFNEKMHKVGTYSLPAEGISLCKK